MWPVPKYEKFPELERPELLVEVFESTFVNALKREANRRRPKLHYRKEALRDLTDEDLNQVCSLFVGYFKGELSISELTGLLRKDIKLQRKRSYR